MGVPQPHPPAMPLRTTREPREALPAQSNPPQLLGQTGTHRGISEPVRAQFTYSSNKDAGGKGRAVLWQFCQRRGGNWGSVGLCGRLFKGSGCFCTPLCLSIGPSSGVPLPWAEEPPLRTAPPSLFVLLEKFPSACESRLGSLTGNIWLERRKTGVRVVRSGEGSRLLATREAGWAAPAHRVGRLQGSALGRSRGPSLTVTREGTHSLTTSRSVLTSQLFGASSCLTTTIFCSSGQGPSSSAWYLRPCRPLLPCSSPCSSGPRQAQRSVRPQDLGVCQPRGIPPPKAPRDLPAP